MSQYSSNHSAFLADWCSQYQEMSLLGVDPAPYALTDGWFAAPHPPSPSKPHGGGAGGGGGGGGGKPARVLAQKQAAGPLGPKPVGKPPMHSGAKPPCHNKPPPSSS